MSNHMDDIKPMGDMWLAAHHLPANLKLYPESALLQAKEEGRREGMREATSTAEAYQVYVNK